MVIIDFSIAVIYNDDDEFVGGVDENVFQAFLQTDGDRLFRACSSNMRSAALLFGVC